MTTRAATKADGAEVGHGAGQVPPADAIEAVMEGRALLTRAAILAAEDITYDYCEVPEWGGVVRVRCMTGAERDAYDAESYLASQKPNGTALDGYRIRRVARCIVDENGIRIFSDQDIAAVGAKNGAIIDRIDDVIVRLSKIGADEQERATTDLKADQSAGSGSA